MTRNDIMQRGSPHKQRNNEMRVFLLSIVNNFINPIFPVEPLSHGGMKIISKDEEIFFKPTWQKT